MERVNVLNDMAGLRLDDLLDGLGVRLSRRGKLMAGPCPVHGGRRADAFTLYPDGYQCRGNWKCRSRGCHGPFKGTLLGLAWGVLSRQERGWCQDGDETVPFAAAVDYACRLLGVRLEDVRVDRQEVEKARFSRQAELLGRAPSRQPGWSRSAARARMDIPSAYYLKRGYRPETLDRYDVGTWLPGGEPSPMAGRAAVCVYDEDHSRVVGVTGRSPWGRCPSCGSFHDPLRACPPEKGRPEDCKWHSRAFKKEEVLYNFWFAHKHVRRGGQVVLVEGPGDVWRLEEAGVPNSVALFGTELNDPQQVLLERSGAQEVVLLPHSDDAGRASEARLRAELGGLFNVRSLRLARKDVGEMSVSEVREEILPFLEARR